MQAEKLAHDDYQAELDRINKKELALIAAEAKSGPLSDVDESGTPDVLEMSKIANEQSRAIADYQAKMKEIEHKDRVAAQKIAIENKKIDADLRNQDNDLAIAKLNAKNRGSKSK